DHGAAAAGGQCRPEAYRRLYPPTRLNQPPLPDASPGAASGTDRPLVGTFAQPIPPWRNRRDIRLTPEPAPCFSCDSSHIFLPVRPPRDNWQHPAQDGHNGGQTHEMHRLPRVTAVAGLAAIAVICQPPGTEGRYQPSQYRSLSPGT